MDADMTPDASLDVAVAAITKKLGPQNFDADPDGYRPEPVDARERPDDAIEREGASDLEELEREERDQPEAKAEGEEAKAGEEGEGDQDEQFIELPPAAEGEHGEKIPLNEAVEAVQKLRQMDADIASVVIKAEDEAFAKQDEITQGLRKTFEDVSKQAEFAYQMLQDFLPQRPDPRLLNGSADDVAEYHRAVLYYDQYVQHAQKVWNTLDGARKGVESTGGLQDTEFARREMARAARFIPEFKDDAGRKARIEDYVKTLGPKYGLTANDLDGIVDHKAWRIINDLFEANKAKTEAPAVRKHVQEKAAKLVKGRLPPQDPSTGRFISQAAKELKETGTEEAFAKKFIASGRLKNL